MLLKILEHFLDRFVQAVEIKPVESDLRPVICKRAVVIPEPTDEVQHIGIPPHPLGEIS